MIIFCNHDKICKSKINQMLLIKKELLQESVILLNLQNAMSHLVTLPSFYTYMYFSMFEHH